MIPYQKAKTYDIYIKKKAIPTEMLADTDVGLITVSLTAVCLTSSIFWYLKGKKTHKKTPRTYKKIPFFSFCICINFP